MRQAIETKYLGPTDHHGSRVKAFAEAGSITLGWDHRHNQQDNHVMAAKALQAKLGWEGAMVGGGLARSSGYAFVILDMSAISEEIL